MSCLVCLGRAPFCDVCLAQRVAWHVGQARVAGRRWGASLHALMPGRPWPSYETSVRLREICRRKMTSLCAGDERLHDRLAREYEASARQEYTVPSASPGSVSFRSRRWDR